jgi:outer membrane murein-binding lipoprotein Lpp
MKKIILITCLCVVALFLVGCAEEMTDEEVDVQLEELSADQLADVLSEDSEAIAGQATHSELRNAVADIRFLNCEDSDGGKKFKEFGEISVTKQNGRTVNNKYKDDCSSVVNGQVLEAQCKQVDDLWKVVYKKQKFDICENGVGINLQCGDINDDGQVNSDDSDYASTRLSSLTVEEKRRGDLNQDGVVDWGELTTISEFSQGDDRLVSCAQPRAMIEGTILDSTVTEVVFPDTGIPEELGPVPEDFAVITACNNANTAFWQSSNYFILEDDLNFNNPTSGNNVCIPATPNLASTIDCRGHTISGVQRSGNAVTEQTAGISVTGRKKVTIKNCKIKGLNNGIKVSSFSTGNPVDVTVVDTELTHNKIGVLVGHRSKGAIKNTLFTRNDVGISMAKNTNFNVRDNKACNNLEIDYKPHFFVGETPETSGTGNFFNKVLCFDDREGGGNIECHETPINWPREGNHYTACP